MPDQLQILISGAEILRIEGQALLDTADHLDPRFADMVTRIHQSTGRLVLTGVGKSAQVGQKIAATLNSTGTPALFMHAADAIHGDLGMLQPDDLLLCISKSGNTPEIKVLIPWVRSMGNSILAMVSDPGSFLEEQADLSFRIPVSREACPFNLTPTTSTTLQLAAGDALALSLLRLKGFSAEKFARLHPGGTLGKRMHTTVGDLYTHNLKPAVAESDPVMKVILTISSNRLGATAVLNHLQHPTGIVTDGDLRRMLEKDPDIHSLKAYDIMTARPKTIEPGELAVHALGLMRKHSITQLLVVANNQYLGVIHLHDILREGIPEVS